MFSFFKKKKPALPVPEWAAVHFDATTYTVFIEAVETWFNNNKIPFSIENGFVDVKNNEMGVNQMGLDNVAMVCKRGKPGDYTRIINDHFDTLRRSWKEQEKFEKFAADFEKAKSYLAVRLYNNNYFPPGTRELLVGATFAGDVTALLVFDLPETITNVKTKQVEQWGQSIDTLFELGLQNVRNKYPFPVSLENMGSTKVWLVGAEHFFTTNIVFDLHQHPEMMGNYGALVGIPTRHNALIYPVQNLEVVSVITQFIGVILGMHRDGPGQVSNQLFWYHDGTYTPLPYTVEEGKLIFSPPDSFIAVLQTMKQVEEN